MSIVDLIKDQLSGDLLGRLSSVIGESEEKTKAAAGAAVPSLLSVLANSVLSGRGLEGLLEALRNYDGTDPAAKLRTPGAEAESAPDEGTDVLGSILGPNLTTLINLLSKFSHIAGPAMKSLISYLGPIILSAIAAQLKGKGGLTPANLTSFFTAEKANISKAMPAGLSLVDLPSIPGVPTTVPKATEGGPPAWLLPALAVGLIGLGAWFFLKPPAEPEPPAEGAPASAASDPVKNIPPPPIDAPIAIPSADEVTKSLSDVYSGATQTLADVKDVPTAEAAAPKLSDLGSKIDVLKALWDKLPAEAKALVAKVTAEHLGTLKDVVAKVLEIPGVGEKLKPILDALLEKLAGFTA